MNPYSVPQINNQLMNQAQIPSQFNQPTRDSSVRPTRQKRSKKDTSETIPEKQRRPMNAFMIFAQTERIKLIKDNPGKDNRYI